MRIEQLIEGQERQIERLHFRTALRLYMPLSLEDAIHAAKHGLGSMGRHEVETGGISKQEGIPVTHSLRVAYPYGDVVMQFTDIAKHLGAPRYLQTPGIQKAAKQHYPESQMPMISLMLLSEKSPWVNYHGILSPKMIDLFHLVGYDLQGNQTPHTGVNDSLNLSEFEEWLVNAYQMKRRSGKPGRKTNKMMDFLKVQRPEVYD